MVDNTLVQEPNTQIAKSQSSSEVTLDDVVITLSNNLTIPSLWDSRDAGEAFIWHEYLCILQCKPISMAESMYRRGLIEKKEQKQMVRTFSSNLEYLYSMTVYYKPGCNPVGIDSHRPAQILTLEKRINDGANPPMFCCFQPAVRSNMGSYNGAIDKAAVRRLFLERLTHGHPEEVTHIGTIDDAFKIITGQDRERNTSKGCFLNLLLLLSIAITGITVVGISLILIH